MQHGDVQKGTSDIAEAQKLVTGLTRELEWRLKLRQAIAASLLGEKNTIEDLDEVVEGARLAEDRETHAAALLWKARALAAQGALEECFETARLARSTSLDTGQVLMAAEASLVLASLERSLGQTLKGLEDYGQAEQTFMLVGDEGLMARANIEQALFELCFSNSKASLRLANEARSFYMSQGSRRHLAMCFKVSGIAITSRMS